MLYAAAVGVAIFSVVFWRSTNVQNELFEGLGLGLPGCVGLVTVKEVESSTFGGNERQVTFRIGSETARVFSTMWFHNDILIPEATVTKPDNP